MFSRLRQLFSDTDKPEAAAAPQGLGQKMAAEWAKQSGMKFTAAANGRSYMIEGEVDDRSFRLECGQPTREFIHGEEIRIRGDISISQDVSVLIMNRPLKVSLDSQAYSLYTDSLQTTVGAELPEEMRWLSMYQEVGWESVPRSFWERYSVIADQKENALVWLDAELAQALMHWPDPGPSAEVPFILMLAHGRSYLRMEHNPADLPTMQHALDIFKLASIRAVQTLKTPGAFNRTGEFRDSNI